MRSVTVALAAGCAAPSAPPAAAPPAQDAPAVFAIERSAIVRATRDQVYQAFALPGEIARWLADRAEGDGRVGGRLRLRYAGPGGRPIDLRAEVADLVPGRAIALRFRHSRDAAAAYGADPDRPPRHVVRVSLADTGGGTMVRVRDEVSGGDAAYRRAIEDEWDRRLGNLRSVLEEQVDLRELEGLVAP